jgi:hypothetical protein
MSATTYNGWTNHATWLVNLHLSNDRCAHDVALGAWRYGAGVDTRYAVSEALKSMVESWLVEDYDSSNPMQCMKVDLINATLSDVNWYELADHLIEALNEEFSS